jgi:hypothetical protein
MPGLFCCLIFCRPVWFKFGDVREIAVVLPEVEAITYHVVVGNLEAHVGQVNVDNAAPGAIKENANVEARGLVLAQRAHNKVRCEAGIDDVFNEKDVPLGQGLIEIFGQADHAMSLFGGTIAGNGQEVNRNRYRDGTQQVGHKEKNTLKNSNYDQVLPDIIAIDLSSQFFYALLDLFLSQEYRADIPEPGGY